MSDADARSDIEREYEEAKKTAREYLRAVGVLSPEGKDKQERDTEQRWREERKMRNTILRGWAPDAVVPNDRQQRETAVAILNVGGGDDAVQQQALRPRVTPPIWDASTCIAVVTTKYSTFFSKGIALTRRFVWRWIGSSAGCSRRAETCRNGCEDGMKSRGN